MDRRHMKGCVIAAAAAGGKPCSDAKARAVLASVCGIAGRGILIIRDGPVRPVYQNRRSYYIPYHWAGVDMELAAGEWVEEIRREEEDEKRRGNHAVLQRMAQTDAG